MKQTIDNTQFADGIRDIRENNFTSAALDALFEYYEDMEEAIGEDIEFDPIAICCEWSEMDEDEARREYSHLDGMDECEDLDDIAELLNDETMVLNTGDTIVVAAF